MSLQCTSFPPCPYNAHPFHPVPTMLTLSCLSLQCQPCPPCLYNSVLPFLVALYNIKPSSLSLPFFPISTKPSLSSLSLQCPPFLPVPVIIKPSHLCQTLKPLVSCLVLVSPHSRFCPRVLCWPVNLWLKYHVRLSPLIQNHHLVGAQQGKKTVRSIPLLSRSRPFFQL